MKLSIEISIAVKDSNCLSNGDRHKNHMEACHEGCLLSKRQFDLIIYNNNKFIRLYLIMRFLMSTSAKVI